MPEVVEGEEGVEGGSLEGGIRVGCTDVGGEAGGKAVSERRPY